MAKVTTEINGKTHELNELTYRQQIELFEQFTANRRAELIDNLDAFKINDAGRAEAMTKFERESVFAYGVMSMALRAPMRVIEKACESSGVDPLLFELLGAVDRVEVANKLLGLEVRPLEKTGNNAETAKK